ncbi:enolase-phosphatase E1-like [Oryza brachyantha]|uniref:SHSP domain-containing protein n=1 Tax=Oryza brachyantha TaxID=4533 RepID=J3L1F5_ORYBR|nr:enolase-phosphatase E1-like [Oryza brachyantha]
MASRPASSAAAAEQQQRDGDYEPVYEWLDAGANYLLRLNVPEFKKEDFQVHVDASGRLTVRGQRGSLRLNKVFQLPATSNLDGITGRLEGTVLILTVPKLPAASAAAATAPPPPKVKEEEEADAKKPDTKKKRAIEELVTGKPAERLAAGEEPKAAPAAAAPPPRREPETAPERRERKDEDDDKLARAGAEHKARVAREADRRIEAARARLAAQHAPKPAPEKKAPCWKDRAAEEGMRLAEAIGKNKEVVATAVAAFALGVFVSSKLFSRNN